MSFVSQHSSSNIMLVHVLREYNVNKILLSHLGLWPLQNKFVRNFLPLLYLVVQMSYFPFEILMLYDHWENAQLVFEVCYHFVVLILFTVKLLNEFCNSDKSRRIYEAMENHWNIFTSEFEMRVLREYSILSRKITIFYSITIYLMLVIFIMGPFKPILLDIMWPLNESRPRFFAISVEWRIDKDKYFVPLLCYNTIVIVMGIIILVGTDTIYITRTIHACSLFSIIGQQFEKMMPKPDVNMEVNKRGVNKCCINALFKSTSEQVIYQEYVICLKKYQLALEFVDVLNSMYRIVALILLLCTVGCLSLAGIRIIYLLDQLEEMTQYIAALIGVLLGLIILCYPGQKLLNESQNVFHQVYAAEWYTLSPRLKSLIIITLYRSSIPCGLTAGNVFSLSMTTYAAVVRTGMSYFTAFLSLKH